MSVCQKWFGALVLFLNSSATVSPARRLFPASRNSFDQLQNRLSAISQVSDLLTARIVEPHDETVPDYERLHASLRPTKNAQGR